MPVHVLPFSLPRVHHAALPVDPQNERLIVKTAEHQSQPAVLRQMRRSFTLTAGEIEVGNTGITQHAERIEPFGRYVNPAFVGRRRVEEYMLLGNKPPEFLI